VSATKDAALKNAILATELYMKAIELASSESDKARLRGKCKLLLSRAEEIKASEGWSPSMHTGRILKVPLSTRVVTKSEEIILLESSKLHGFIFPPWTSDPGESAFDESSGSYT